MLTANFRAKKHSTIARITAITIPIAMRMNMPPTSGHVIATRLVPSLPAPSAGTLQEPPLDPEMYLKDLQ